MMDREDGMAPERQPNQADQSEGHPDQDTPAYMGKTIAALCYGFSAFAALAGLTLFWLAARAYYQGPHATVSLRDTIPLLAIFGAFCLIIACGLFIWPTVMAQHPKFRLENQYAYEKTNALGAQAFDRSKMNEAIKQAPESLRRRIRLWRWVPLTVFVVLLCLNGASRRGWLPGSLDWLRQAFDWIDQHFGTFPFVFVILAVNSIPLWLLRREALLLHNRRLARAGDATHVCPDCNYPIDTGNPSTTCPECGFDRSPAGAKTP